MIGELTIKTLIKIEEVIILIYPVKKPS